MISTATSASTVTETVTVAVAGAFWVQCETHCNPGASAQYRAVADTLTGETGEQRSTLMLMDGFYGQDS